MKFNVLNRRVHYWGSSLVAVPILVIITSGLLLQMKKQVDWVQPAERRGTGTVPTITFTQVFDTLKREPSLGVHSWDDISRMDVRADRGLIKVSLTTGYEAQIDLGTGQLLQVAYRRSDLIESIHDGSFFAGDWSKLGLFLPSGVTLLVLWVSGLWMFWVPFAAKRRRAADAKRAQARQLGNVPVR